MMAPYDSRLSERRYYWTDAWDGYPAARARLLGILAEHDINNCIVTSGDIHSFFVSDLKLDFNDPRSTTVATEFVTSSITWQTRPQRLINELFAANPHLKLIEQRYRGYVVLDLARKECVGTLRAVNTVKRRNSRVSTRAKFSVDPELPGARKG